MLDHVRHMSLSALVVAGLCIPPSQARAQARPRPEPLSQAPLQGVVVDEATYQPVDSATVRIVGTDIVVPTGRWGSFAFAEVPTGPLAIQVSAPGHPSVVQDVAVGADGVVFVQVVLPSVAAVLSELLVPSRAPRASAAEAARTAADLLALEVPRTRVNPGIVGKSDYELRLRPGNTIQGNGAPLILVDGVVVSVDDSGYDALARIPASDVEEIEVLKGPAAASRYPFAANGVINVRTKRGEARRGGSR